jgi:hypothetical protein
MGLFFTRQDNIIDFAKPNVALEGMAAAQRAGILIRNSWAELLDMSHRNDTK